MESDFEAPAIKKRRIKPKGVKVWEDDDVFKLILLVEQFKFLWDVNNYEYHNKLLRKCAWQNITEEFNNKYTQRNLYEKWRNLKHQFRGYAERIQSKSGQGAIESPKWKFFTSLSFLGGAEDHQTVSNTRVGMISSESDSCKYNTSQCAIFVSAKYYILFKKVQKYHGRHRIFSFLFWHTNAEYVYYKIFSL